MAFVSTERVLSSTNDGRWEGGWQDYLGRTVRILDEIRSRTRFRLLILAKPLTGILAPIRPSIPPRHNGFFRPGSWNATAQGR